MAVQVSDQRMPLADRLTVAATQCDAYSMKGAALTGHEWAGYADLFREARDRVQVLADLAADKVAERSEAREAADRYGRAEEELRLPVWGAGESDAAVESGRG